MGESTLATMTAQANPALLRIAAILWPSFGFAGVLDGIAFAVVDPAELVHCGAVPIDWSPMSIYSATFFVLWLFISLSAALTTLLLVAPDDAVARSQAREP
jgi:hypothetical protein